ncbi:hypothetical protein QQ045_019806 [Rhodiola kirilowii]
MTSTKVKIKRFDGKGDFALWKWRIKDVLCQMKVSKALEGENKLPATMTQDEKDEAMKKNYLDSRWITVSLLRIILDDFAKNVIDLENINEKIEDEDQAIMVLNSLPPKYYTLVDTMKCSRDTTLSMYEVSAALKSKQIESKVGHESDDGLVAHGKSFRPNFQKKNFKTKIPEAANDTPKSKI